jgi:aminoglycoside phosphotransferase
MLGDTLSGNLRPIRPCSHFRREEEVDSTREATRSKSKARPGKGEKQNQKSNTVTFSAEESELKYLKGKALKVSVVPFARGAALRSCEP